MTSSAFQLRPAAPADAEDLAPLAQRVFHRTFSGDPDHKPADMAAYFANELSPAVLAREIADPELSYTLAVAGDTLIGYSKIAGGHAPECVSAARPLELCRMYVDFDWHGRGVAAALMRHFMDEGARRGCDVLWLGVWHRNERAQRFYRKFGFAHVGAHPFLFGSDLQEDLVFSRPIPVK